MLKPYNRAELHFDLVAEIGQEGKNSRTFIAHDHQLNAQIVIKQIEKAKLNGAAQFFDESKCLYASSHPNVVQIFYACEDDDNVYVAMPHYTGGSVKALMQQRYLSVREVIRFGCHILSGLHNIHSKSLIHFDIKPDNVLLSGRNEALISDFGLAQHMVGGIAGQDRLYMKMVPPEAFAGDHFDRTFDIYQFGLTLYRMCNGDLDFYNQFENFGTGANFDRIGFRTAVRNEQFPNRSQYKAHIPLKMRNIIRKCLQSNPDNRYQSALEVSNELAVVDGNKLDWLLTEHADRRVWEKNIDSITLTFQVGTDGASTLHRRNPAGNVRRIVEGCQAGIGEVEVKRILGAY
jgi:eukaryotic-like serine/threonine-protein kinase